MTGKASISDFNFSHGSDELTPFDVSTLISEYADGRRKFNQIDLKQGNLSDAHLPYIHLEESILQKADLRNAILAGSSLNHIDLSAANLTRANLIAADLIRAKLAGANLSGAFLSGANLSGANLRKSNLTNCTLAGANLSGVDFTGAIFKNTNMAGATLRGANLSAVDLSELDLSELNLAGSILPEDQGGMTWTALKAGQPGYQTDDDPFPSESSQGLPDGYPLDAFDDSYDDLIQNLADPSDWLQTIEPNAIVEDLPEVEGTEGSEAPLQGSPFEPGEMSSDEPDYRATADSPFLASPFEPAEPVDLPEPPEAPNLDAIVLGSVEDDPHPDYPNSPFSMPEVGQPIPLNLPPDETALPEEATGYGDVTMDEDVPRHEDTASHEDVTLNQTEINETEPGVGESNADPAPELESIPLSPIEVDPDTPQPVDNPSGFVLLADEALPAQADQNSGPDLSQASVAADEPRDEATIDTVIEPKLPHNLHQQRHQEQVVKSIQAVFNRRTHYSLQRKLLEVYSKRCAITGCHIVPLLDTVLIDSWEGATVDHPSNGLVLRCDLKLLYDLNLIAVHPTKHTVMLAPSLQDSQYGLLQGQKIRLPKQGVYRPTQAHLQAHLDHCKWSTYDTDSKHVPGGVSVPPKHTEESPRQASGLSTRLAFLAAGVVLGGVLTGILGALLSLRTTPDLAPSSSQPPPGEVETPAPGSNPVVADADETINLRLGPLVYPQGGVIYNDSAYISVKQLVQAGVLDQLEADAEVINANGEDYVRATYTQTLGVDPAWDAETRTITLDCCSNPDIEPIDITIEGRNRTDTGVIVEGSAYAPADILAQFDLDPQQVPGDNFVEIDQQLFVRAGGLQPLGIEIAWDADTRILNLEAKQ
jgi:uncharacterized protein YjbI with pentapeptide repeats